MKKSILFLAAMLVFGSLLAIAHNIVISDNIEKQKSKSVKITAFVDHLGYEARVKHFVASVIYTVDDKEYKANVDNVTTENKHGSKIDIYINPNNPPHLLWCLEALFSSPIINFLFALMFSDLPLHLYGMGRAFLSSTFAMFLSFSQPTGLRVSY